MFLLLHGTFLRSGGLSTANATRQAAWSRMLASFATRVSTSYGSPYMLLACGPNSMESHCTAVRAAVNLMASPKVCTRVTYSRQCWLPTDSADNIAVRSSRWMIVGGVWLQLLSEWLLLQSRGYKWLLQSRLRVVAGAVVGTLAGAHVARRVFTLTVAVVARPPPPLPSGFHLRCNSWTRECRA